MSELGIKHSFHTTGRMVTHWLNAVHSLGMQKVNMANNHPNLVHGCHRILQTY